MSSTEKTDTNLKYPVGFFDDLIGHFLYVACDSWPKDFAEKKWGPEFGSKTTPGEIRQVKHTKSGAPKFIVRFDEINQTVQGLDLDYVLKYSNDVPLKYHTVKAEYIMRLAREAMLPAAPKQRGKRSSMEFDEETNPHILEIAQPKTSGLKRGGNMRVVQARDKKRAVAEQQAKESIKPAADSKDSGDEYNLSEMDDEDSEKAVDSEEKDFETDDEGPNLGAYDAAVEEGQQFEPEDEDVDFINWQHQIPPFQPEQPFSGQGGPKHGLAPETALPIDYFCLFIPVFWWSRFAKYTNCKAEMAKTQQEGKIREWAPTCGAEIKAWVGSVIWWCIFKSLTFQQFFEQKIESHRVRKWFSSWKRWQGIKRFFKACDPLDEDKNKHDKMFKVRELFDYFIQACRSNYSPRCEVALDEAIKKFKGRCSFKQYIKNKPIRWGIKIFCVCCCFTSYLLNACFYVGKSEESEREERSVTHKTVLNLMTPFSGKKHRLYMDNYYTGIPLFRDLEKMEIYSTGTVRTNRKGLDPRVTVKKTEESKLKKNPGTTRYSSYGNMVYASWYDKRPVHMLSNCHLPEGDDTVQHWFPARPGEVAQTKSGKILKLISICPIVKWYRKFMGAVDRFDQFRSYIRLEMRTAKFWHVMFWFIIESALVNAYILYKVTRELALLPVEYSHLEFRIAIVLALVAEWESMGCVYDPKLDPAVVTASPNAKLKVGAAFKVRKSLGTSSEKRFKATDLHMSHMEKLPVTAESKGKLRQLRCIRDSCKSRTSFWCRACSAPLCVRNNPSCFLQYHQK